MVPPNKNSMLVLTDRQRMLVGMALRYALANVDDLNDVFADTDDESMDNVEGRLDYHGEKTESADEAEFTELLEKMGEVDSVIPETFSRIGHGNVAPSEQLRLENE
jgi:hypothetical protein